MRNTTCNPTRNLLTLVPREPKSRALRKGADEWRSIAHSWRIKDGRSVIVSVPIDGEDPFIGEAYWHVETGAWWLANTAPNKKGLPSIFDVFGSGPTMWHPMPPKPPVKHRKSAVSRGSGKAPRMTAH
jgi:hypothetical protein